MARKKKEKVPSRAKAQSKPSYGWAAEEAAEEKLAEGLKRSDLDSGKVMLVDRDISTPVIETYDANTGELEGSILLKDGNREGVTGLVKIIENVDVELDHDSNIESINFKGKLSVENQSKKDLKSESSELIKIQMLILKILLLRKKSKICSLFKSMLTLFRKPIMF
ncbi:MAG: hypothetical protein ACTSQU_06470 [Promethearchaeota archaeon]